MDVSSLALLRAVMALSVVLGLIMGATWLLRRYGGRLPLRRSSRLAVVETLPLDNRRRLLLIRRDDRLHLIMTGGANDLLIETLPPEAAAPDREERKIPS